MNFFRRLGLGLSATIFSLAILLFAGFISIYYVLDTPKPLESALQQSGVYDITVQNVLEQTQKNKSNDTSSLPLNDATVQSAVQAAIPPATVQTQTEQAINSVYDWMHGTTKTPTFSIDLSQQKSDIADNIGATLTQKLNNLPVCKTGTQLPQNAADILAMTCRPAGVSTSSLVTQVEQQVRGTGVIQDSSLTANNLKDSNGRQLTDKLNYIPKLHHYFILSLFVLPVIILLTGIIILFASQTRRLGVRRMSATFLTTGIYGTVGALLSVWLYNWVSSTITNRASDQQILVSKLFKAGGILLTDLRKWWLVFGIGYLVLGIIGLIVVRATRSKQLKTTRSHADVDNDSATPATNSLGHNTNIPQAGTTFTPKAQTPNQHTESSEPETDETKGAAEPETSSEPDEPNNKPL